MLPDTEATAYRDAIEDVVTFDRRIWSIIQLPPQQRAVVVARLYRGLSTDETARRLQKRPGTVKATLNHAMKRLRQIDRADGEPN